MNTHVEVYAAGIPFPEGPAFGADGNLYVCARRDCWIAKVTRERKVIRLCETGGKPQALALSPDGQLYLADAIRRQVLTVGLDGNLKVIVDDQRLIGPNDLAFGPISGDLYFTDPGNEWNVYNGCVYRYSFNEKCLTRLAKNLGFPNGLAVKNDETLLFVGESLSNRLLAIHLQEVDLLPERAFQFTDGAVPDGMEWLADGRLAVALHGAGRISILDTATWQESSIALAAESHPTNVIPDGEHLYVSDDTAGGIVRVSGVSRCSVTP